jgi:hypothetical protein
MNIKRQVMMIKQILVTIFILSSMTSCAQNKTELSTLKLNENTETLLKGTADVHKGEMFDRADMISYGITNEKFTYRGYFPEHIEVLSYKGELAGYAFKVYKPADQEKLIADLKAQYQGLTENRSYYSYKNNVLLIEFQAISKEQFAKGMNAYLSVKRLDFYEAYEKLMNQYNHH